MSKHGETQSNDILGIRKIFGEEWIWPFFGLNSYYFEIITDVEKQEGISNDYTENLHIFLLMTKTWKKIEKIKMKFGVERRNKWMIFHGLIFFLLSLYPKLDFLCVSIYHLLFVIRACNSYSNFIKVFNRSTFLR